MVRGLDRFREHFAGWEDHYVLIGGTAASINMDEATIPFRETRDLDMVLHFEVLTSDFMAHFWAFVKEAGYTSLMAGEGVKPRFYRFERPADANFPSMIELLCRKPDAFDVPEGVRIVPIRANEFVSDLSAILLDDLYYKFVFSGTKIIDGISLIGEDRLIPLKALAWMNLRQDRSKGLEVRTTEIVKHLNDVFRLGQLLDPAEKVDCPDRIQDDIRQFIDLATEHQPNMAQIGIQGVTAVEMLDRIRDVFLER